LANILIVDDSSTVRRVIFQMVTKMGHNVIAEAKTGLEGFEMYEQYKPDIVTMDMEMPGGDGINALRHIIKKYPKAVIVMVTSINFREKVLECIQLGAKNYVIKPIDEEKMASVINDIITKYINQEEEKKDPLIKTISIVDQAKVNPLIKSFSLGGTFTLDIYKSIDDSLITQINTEIQSLLFVKPFKIQIKIRLNESNINTSNLYKIIDPINKIGGIVEINYLT
jgi:YesN/AraC family two-component response regulator